MYVLYVYIPEAISIISEQLKILFYSQIYHSNNSGTLLHW